MDRCESKGDPAVTTGVQRGGGQKPNLTLHTEIPMQPEFLSINITEELVLGTVSYGGLPLNNTVNYSCHLYSYIRMSEKRISSKKIINLLRPPQLILSSVCKK